MTQTPRSQASSRAFRSAQRRRMADGRLTVLLRCRVGKAGRAAARCEAGTTEATMTGRMPRMICASAARPDDGGDDDPHPHPLLALPAAARCSSFGLRSLGEDGEVLAGIERAHGGGESEGHADEGDRSTPRPSGFRVRWPRVFVREADYRRGSRSHATLFLFFSGHRAIEQRNRNAEQPNSLLAVASNACAFVA